MTPRQKQAVALYRKDISTHAACEELGISRQAYHQLLDKAGYRDRKRSRPAARHDKFFDSIASDLRRAAKAGYSLGELADEIGFGLTTVVYQLERLKIRLRRKRFYSDAERKRWERLYRTNSTIEIATITGASQTAIWDHLRSQGLVRSRDDAGVVASKKYWKKIRAKGGRTSRRFTAADHKRWEKLYREFKSTSVVAKTVGVSQRSVYNHLQRRGLLLDRSEVMSVAGKRRTARRRAALEKALE